MPLVAMFMPTSEPGVPSGMDLFLLLVLVAVSPVESAFVDLDFGLAFVLASPSAPPLVVPSLRTHQ